MAQITYADKVALNINGNIADINKVNASDMNEIKSVVNANETTMNNTIVDLGGTILWTNSNPNNDFSAQNVQVDLSNYDAYEIKYYSSRGDTLVLSTGILPKIGNGTKLFMTFNTQGNNFITSRTIEFISNGLKFYDANYYAFNSGSEGTANNRCIPLYIIGYNTGLFN